MKDWVPLFSKLVWPVLILIGLVAFNQQVSELYNFVLTAIKEGRGVKFGGFLELSEKAKATNIQEIAGSRLKLEAVKGRSTEAVKGSMRFLQQLKRQVENSPNQRIEVLKIVDGPRYSAKVIEEYITALGVRFIVFEKRGKFDGWIDAGVFMGQLRVQDRQLSRQEGREHLYRYPELKSIITGINTDSVGPNVSAKSVLELMQERDVDRMAVVSEDKRFQFIVERGDILAKLMTSLLLEEKAKSP